MKKYWTIFCLLTVGLSAPVLQSCKKDAETETPPPGDPAIVQTTINGAIELPSGSPRNVNTLSILSPVAAGTVSTGQYQVSTIQNEFTTQIAADAAGQPVLMGYCYPGQTDFAINARSTVLAMLMNTGVAYSLTPAGKQQLIPRLTADPAFAAVVQEVERILRTSGTALLDTTNNALGDQVVALFTNISRRGQSGLGNAVRVDRAGRNLSFTNAGVPFYNTVGVYKDGQQIHQVTVDGANFFASTPTALLAGLASIAGGPSATPAQQTYTLPGDGQFDIRIRSGKFGAAANGPEQRTALAYNLAQSALLTLTGFLPQYSGKTECAKAVATGVLNAAFNYRAIITASSEVGMTVATGKFSKATFDNSLVILQTCQGQNSTAAAAFLSPAKKLFAFLTKQVGRVGSGLNLTALVGFWAAYPAAQDTCFVAAGTTVGPCNSDLQLLTNGSSNNSSSKIWRIMTTSGTPYPTCREGTLTLNNDRGYLRFDHEEYSSYANASRCDPMLSSGATFSYNANTRALTFSNLRATGTAQSFQVTRLDRNNLEIRGTTNTERWTLVAR